MFDPKWWKEKQRLVFHVDFRRRGTQNHSLYRIKPGGSKISARKHAVDFTLRLLALGLVTVLAAASAVTLNETDKKDGLAELDRIRTGVVELT